MNQSGVTYKTGRFQATGKLWWGRIDGDKMVFITEKEFTSATVLTKRPELDKLPF